MYLPYSVKYGKITITHVFEIIQSYLIVFNPRENFYLCFNVRELKVLRMPICKISFLKKTLQYQVPLYFSSASSDVSPFMLQFDVSSVNVTIINGS